MGTNTGKFNITLLITWFFFAASLSSCSSNGNQQKQGQSDQRQTVENGQHQHEHGQGQHHNDEGNDGHHHEEKTTSEASDLIWTPNQQPFSGNLELVKGNPNKLNATIIDSEGEETALTLQFSGNEAILLLKKQELDNVGVKLQFNSRGFEGNISLLHHYQDSNNYDLVQLTSQSMKLGRVTDGQMKVLDDSNTSLPEKWSTLKLSAAGSHFKGYLDDELLTHGHDEPRNPGRVGVKIKGKGQVMLKQLSVVLLNE